MKKLLTLFALLVVCVSGAWAEDGYTTRYSLDFENAETFKDGWNINGDLDPYQGNANGGKVFCMRNKSASGNRAASISFSGNTDFTNATDYYFEFDWGCLYQNREEDKVSDLTVSSATGTLFTVKYNYNTAPIVYDKSNTEIATLEIDGMYKSTNTVPSKYYHFVIKGDENGVKLTISNSTKTYATDYILDNNFSVINRINANPARNGSIMAFDNFDLLLPTKYTATLNAVDENGDLIKTIDLHQFNYGETYSTYAPKAVVKNGICYVTSTTAFKQTFTGTETKSITYIASPNTVVYEESDLTLSRSFAATTNKDFFSNGSGGRLYANAYAYSPVLEGGVYTLVIAGCVNTRTPSFAYGYRLNGVNILLGETDTFNNGNWEARKTVEHIYIPAGASFCAIENTGYNSNFFIDYVMLTKTGDLFNATPETNATCLITNPEIKGTASGWTCERPNGGNGPLLSNNSFEFWGDDINNASVRDIASFDYHQTITNLPSGFYTVSAEMYNSLNNEDGAVFNESCGVYGNDVIAYVTTEGNNLNRYTTAPVLVTDGTLRIGVKSDKRMGARWFVADNFQLTYLGESIDVLVTVGTAGLSSYVTPYALDFTDSKVKAYIVKNVSATSVTLSPVNVVPAQTPIIVGGETDNVPTTTADADDVSENMLRGSNTATYTVLESDHIYALSAAAGTFNPVATGVVIPVGKAYLPVSTPGAALRISFGEATAIKTVETTANNAVRYNLAGQRVNANAKGIIVVNGKKVLK